MIELVVFAVGAGLAFALGRWSKQTVEIDYLEGDPERQSEECPRKWGDLERPSTRKHPDFCACRGTGFIPPTVGNKKA